MSDLFVQALETGIKACLWWAFSSCFTASANEFYIFWQCTYCSYPAMSKSPKQLPNCLKWAETSVILINFNVDLCEVKAYTDNVSYRCSTWIGHQKNYILVS